VIVCVCVCVSTYIPLQEHIIDIDGRSVKLAYFLRLIAGFSHFTHFFRGLPLFYYHATISINFLFVTRYRQALLPSLCFCMPWLVVKNRNRR
jgi:hypothetical protein